MCQYKWVRFKGRRWEIVELIGKISCTSVLRMNKKGFFYTKLIVEYGPGVKMPKHLTYTIAQSKMGLK